MTIKNLTPHAVCVLGEDGSTLKVFPSDGVARASQSNEIVGYIDNIPIVKAVFGEVVNLPEPEYNTLLIVSIITIGAAHAQGRSTNDLIIASNPVRDDSGQIIGCRYLAQV